MKPLDRTTPPELKPLSRFELPEAKLYHLDNGIPLYVIESGSQEVSRLDIMFTTGKVDECTPLAAQMTNEMLKEGAGDCNSAEIAQQLDYYGAWLQPYVSHHNSYVTLFSPNKFFHPSLLLLQQMVLHPTFPQAELSTLVKRKKEQLQQELEKVQSIAAKAFNPYYFGAEHPYGKSIEPHHFDALQREDLVAFHTQHYTASRCKIILAGCITPQMMDAINEAFGKEMALGEAIAPSAKPLHTLPTSPCSIQPKAGAIQSAIRMAIPMVGRDHPDYHSLRLLNTLFGGYFGSRLMVNIREEKGYTYGINSALVALPYGAYLTVATQTATEHTHALIAEVRKEAERLCHERVSDEELQVVKNYMVGELIRLVDGVFQIADAYISLLANGLPFDYFNTQLQQIEQTSADDIQRLAQRYLQPDQFYTLIAGDVAASCE